VRKIIIIGSFLASYSTLVSADDYKDASDAAYCLGALRGEVAILKQPQSETDKSDGQDLQDLEVRIPQLEAFVKGAIKQRHIEAVTASKMQSAADGEVKYCVEHARKCFLMRQNDKTREPTAEKYKEFDNCMKPVETFCNRLERCRQ
jgi:hypothetical protein